MSESMPSLELIADEARTQRDELVRHLDAVDAKAGIVLGASAAVAAIGAQNFTLARGPGVILAVVGALLALSSIVPQRFATWDTAELRTYLVSDPAFTKLAMLDTSLVILTRLRRLLEEKVSRFRTAAVLLGLAVVTTGVGTVVA